MNRRARGWMLAMGSSLVVGLLVGGSAILAAFLFNIGGDDEATFPIVAFLAVVLALLIAVAALCVSAVCLVLAWRCGSPRAGLPHGGRCPECGHTRAAP